MENLFLQFEGLEQAIMLIVGVLGFIIFITLGACSRSRNGLFFALAFAFAFMVLFVICYDHPFFAWVYGEDKGTNVAITLIGMPVFAIISAICFYFSGRLVDRAIGRYKASKLRHSIGK